MQYLIAFCSRLEATSDVIAGMFVRPVVTNKCAKFDDPPLTFFDKFHLKSSEAAFSTVFHVNFQLEVVSDVLSSANAEQVGMDFHVKFGDCGLDGSRDTRLRSHPRLHF